MLVGSNAYKTSLLISKFFRQIKENAEKMLGKPINEAVVTLPDNFDFNQIQVAMYAGRNAGFRNIDVISDEKAALTAYAWQRDEAETALLCDIGAEVMSLVVGEIAEGKISKILFREERFFYDLDIEDEASAKTFVKEILRSIKPDILIDRIVLTGRASKLPFVEDCFDEVFSDTPCVYYRIGEVNAIGAALYKNEHLPVSRGDKLFFDEEILKRDVPYKILVTATMSAGKSTFINALIGEKVSKTENMACTDKILSFANKNVIDEKNNAEDTFYINYNGILKNASIIIKDSPGVNSSMNPLHRKIAEDEIKRGDYDLMIYLIDIRQSKVDDDSFHLKFVRKFLENKPIIFLLNQMDRLAINEEFVTEETEKIKKYLEAHGFINPIVLPISALSANLAQGYKRGDLKDFEKLNFSINIRKFSEGIDIVSYYDKFFPDILIKNSKREEEQLLKLSGFKYVEKLILSSYKGEM